MWIIGISTPIGGAIPNFSLGPYIMVLMMHNKFRLIDQSLAEIQLSEPILGQPR